MSSKSCCTPNKTSSFKTFKVLDVNVLLLPDVLRLVTIFRPPYDPPSWKWTISDFISELSLYFESLVYANGRHIIVGVVNINVDNHDGNDVKKFLDLLYSLELSRHMYIPDVALVTVTGRLSLFHCIL